MSSYDQLLKKYQLDSWLDLAKYEKDVDIGTWRGTLFHRRHSYNIDDWRHFEAFMSSIIQNPFYIPEYLYPLPDHHSNTISNAEKLYFGAVKNLATEDLFDIYHTFIRNSLGLQFTPENQWTTEAHLQEWMKVNRVRDNSDVVSEVIDSAEDFNSQFPVLIDLNAPDSVIIDSIKKWLKDARQRQSGTGGREKPITQAKLKLWKVMRVLAYIDVKIWSRFKNYQPTYQEYGDILFPDERDVDLELRIRRTVAPLAESLLMGDLSRILPLQDMLSVDSK